MLAMKGFYFIGDSAYSLMSFLVTPFDNVLHETVGDNFNFFHSSSRIIVECTFGEVDLRWGILWRSLGFTLKHNSRIIDACLRLHNFIVDFREETSSATLEHSLSDEDCRQFLAVHPECRNTGVFGGEDEEKRDENGDRLVGGRPPKREQASKAYGKQLRVMLRDEYSRQGLERPPTNWYKENNRIFNV